MAYELFRCIFCDKPVTPGQRSILKQVLCWVRSDTGATPKWTESQHKYAHEVCVEDSRKPKHQIETLF